MPRTNTRTARFWATIAEHEANEREPGIKKAGVGPRARSRQHFTTRTLTALSLHFHRTLTTFCVVLAPPLVAAANKCAVPSLRPRLSASARSLLLARPRARHFALLAARHTSRHYRQYLSFFVLVVVGRPLPPIPSFTLVPPALERCQHTQQPTAITATRQPQNTARQQSTPQRKNSSDRGHQHNHNQPLRRPCWLSDDSSP